MKKILLGLSVFLMTLVSAQNYPDYYPNNNYGNGNYGDVDDEFYFPDDYYYEYPSDYYSNDLYQSYYNDYRKSIYDVNWNRFFAAHRLSPWQVQQIIILNDSFPSYSAFNSYYRYNPDRWYYDRFYAMQRILGPNIFIVFQNNYYNGYNPVIYYQNYNRRHYARNIYVVPRYRNVNVNIYRVNKVQYHQSNPRQNIGFQPTRNGTTASTNGTRDNGFRNDGVTANSNTRDNSIRNENQDLRNNEIRNDNSNARNNSGRSQSQIKTQNNNGFRNEFGNKQESIRNVAPTRKVESNSIPRSKQGTESRTPSSSSRNSGQRFTAR
ncbi:MULTISPECIES: hypothetical protein [unclassified Kaistella]|uniref:hypothetical protein n=1 Tax=unclassified Kaistella TaxID=2762626 RepID=UPI002734F8E2|nr:MULTISPECIES: hypothetical protein [unclassified Kaistella]MDP2452606.1 hypothetical protein [Kaistella sp. SH11-4b]MDP2455514.1 hypothetical protein [Kaistella sp. SH40-3]MDP2458418.1 hypothetical protein [Kaistella sp. SH19-2b]